jgi:DNA polymerase III epsilon subunit-like protein
MGRHRMPFEGPVASPLLQYALPAQSTLVVMDTETSDLFDMKKPADDPSQGRLAAVTMIFLDADLHALGSYTRHVRPDGWSMKPGATAVNGLTDEFLLGIGIPVAHILDVYTAAVAMGCNVAAFHAQFDTKVMRSELRRAGRDDLFEGTKQTCLMRAMGSYNKSQGLNGKWPKLSDAIEQIGYSMEGQAHTSQSDAMAAVAIARFLHKRGALFEAKVHYAKDRP